MAEEQEIVEEKSTEVPVTRPDFEQENIGPDGEATLDEEVSKIEQSSDTPELSEIELKAMEQGWKPRGEFDDPDKPFIDADEYLRNAPLYEQKRELRKMLREQDHKYKKELQELKRQVHESKKQGYEQALRDLESKRKEAVEIGDIDAFNELDSQYSKVRDEFNRASQEVDRVSSEPEITEAVSDFLERNQEWFNSNNPDNAQMAKQAAEIERHLYEAKPYLSEEQRLALVEQEIKTLYKDRFINPKKKAAPAVVPAGKAGAQSSGNRDKIRYETLSEDDQRRCKIFLEADPSFTFDDFVEAAQLKERY